MSLFVVESYAVILDNNQKTSTLPKTIKKSTSAKTIDAQHPVCHTEEVITTLLRSLTTMDRQHQHIQQKTIGKHTISVR